MSHTNQLVQSCDTHSPIRRVHITTADTALGCNQNVSLIKKGVTHAWRRHCRGSQRAAAAPGAQLALPQVRQGSPVKTAFYTCCEFAVGVPVLMIDGFYLQRYRTYAKKLIKVLRLDNPDRIPKSLLLGYVRVANSFKDCFHRSFAKCRGIGVLSIFERIQNSKNHTGSQFLSLSRDSY